MRQKPEGEQGGNRAKHSAFVQIARIFKKHRGCRDAAHRSFAPLLVIPEGSGALILGELKNRKIVWLAYVLHHSQIADAHRAEFGPVGHPGNLSFIEADGTLRPGHEVFNDY